MAKRSNGGVKAYGLVSGSAYGQNTLHFQECLTECSMYEQNIAVTLLICKAQLLTGEQPERRKRWVHNFTEITSRSAENTVL